MYILDTGSTLPVYICMFNQLCGCVLQGTQSCEVDDLAPVDSRREDIECSCESYSSAPQDDEGDLAN